MRCLIRHITRKSRAGVDHKDRTVDTDRLSIGRGTDRDVFLQDLHVALHHAIIRQSSQERFNVQARTPSGVRINGRTVQSGTVRLGDVIEVGRSTLRLVRPEPGYDLALEVEARERGDAAEAVEAGATSLQQAGLRRRPWAWLAFVVVLVIGLVLPLADMYRTPAPEPTLRDDGQRRAQRAAIPAERSTRVVEKPLGEGTLFGRDIPWSVAFGDHLWDSGPMSRPHRLFGHECRICHRKPFERVTNEACLGCHEGQPHHADDARLMRVSGLSQQRCAGCHGEHAGSEGLIATTPTLCTDCHARPRQTMPDSELRPVRGFAGRGHPELRIRLVSMNAAGEFEWRRERMDGELREDNGLVYPHDEHLAEEGIEGPEGDEVLACRDCHRPGPEGVAMQPVRYEPDCQRCHELSFEPRDPDRQVPHGDLEAAVEMLEEYYARVALAGGYDHEDAAPPAIIRRQRPAGRELDETERRVALEWASQWADEVAAELVEYRTCKTCHTIERRAGGRTRWRVAPVAMTQDWFPHARFSHAPHRQIDCVDCHASPASHESSDVLMPELGTCQECHGEPRSTARVATRCVDCHGFHVAGELTMEPADADR